MKGMPPEGYQPLLPNPPEDNYCGEVENQSDAGSVVTPSLDNPKGALVTVENPNPRTTSMSTNPLEPLLLCLDSLGNIINEEIPQLLERDFTETYMGSTEPIFGDEYRTPIRPTTAVDTNPTPYCSIWRTSSGHDLYENFESIQQPFPPHDPPVETRPSSQTMNHPIDQVINPTITSSQVHPNAGIITSTHSQGTLIPTPTFTNFHSTSPHVPHDLAGTSFHQRMQTLASQIQLTGGKPPSSEPIPPRRTPFYGRPTPIGGQPPFYVPPGGKPPFSNHTPIVNPSLAGGNHRLLETLHNPGEYLWEAHLPNPMLGGTHIITHKEEHQIPFLLEHLMDNLIWESQTPPRVLKDNNLILPKGLMFILPLMCISLQDLLLTLLKGNMFILLMGKQITRLIMLRTH
jgi:hypothetical protein